MYVLGVGVKSECGVLCRLLMFLDAVSGDHIVEVHIGTAHSYVYCACYLFYQDM